MKKLMFISILILLLISISAVSASDDLNQNITETNDIDISNDNILSASTPRTFTDLQGQIMKTSAGSTLTLYDDYAYTEGTDRTIGIAIYSTTKDIIIDGNGHTLDGKNTARILYVNEGATNIVVKNLNFINGYQDSGAGAVFWKGESGTITDCNFTSNSADKSGGAILVSTSKVTITNCNFEKSVSKSQSGGAIYCNDQATQTTITNNRFTSNSVKTCGAGVGSAGANNIIANNVFTDNTAGESGAAIYTSGKNSKINNNQFIRNKAESGGAIYIETDGITMDGCYFEDNTIHGGGGGAMRWKGNFGTMTNCEFTENIAETRGGAIYWNGDNAKIENNNFTKNNAKTAAAGALLYWGNNAQINSNNFEGNTAPNGYGAALYVDGNSNTVSNNKFSENVAARGGGAIYYNGVSGTVSGNTITDNTAENACGIRWDGASATVTGNTFSGNKNTNGPNIIYGDGAKASVTKNTFINNKESDNCIRWNSADAVIKDNVYQEKAKSTALSLEDITLYYGETGKLIVTLKDSENKVVSGKSVSITFNNKQTAANTNAQGQVSIDIKNLNAGSYPAIAKFEGDSQYEASNATATVTVNKAPTEIVLTDVKDIIFGQEIAITATVNATGGSVTFTIDGENTTLPLTSEGKAIKLFKPTLGDHTYNVTATYNPSANYLGSSVSATFKTTKKPTTLTGEDVTAYLGGKGQLIFTLTDDESKAMGLREVSITFNGQKYSQRTDNDGKVVIDLANLGIGTYAAIVNYEGSEIYAPSNATAIAFVKSTIESEDLVANYGDAKYSAKFVDINGNSLAKGTEVTFTIDNNRYNVKVGNDGIATLDVNKTPGKYVITNVNPSSGEVTTNNITINKMPTETTISGVKDIYVGENLTAIVNVNATGEITVTVNNESQTANYTGGDFPVSLYNITEGQHTITVTFKPANEYYIGSDAKATFTASKRANELTVKTNDIEEGQDAVFEVAATVQTGTVTLTIANKTYTENLTNGKATFTVSNLTADTYEYTVSVAEDEYYKGNSTDGTIKVKSTTLIINAPGLEKYFSNPERFTFTVTDKDGNPLENITIFITLNGRTYNRTTDANGSAGMNIGLPANNYTALLSFKGNDDYSPVNVTSSIVVKTTVYGSDLTKVEKAPGPYSATFLDPNGNKIASGVAEFNINGVLYYRDIVDGIGKLNLNLEAGKYVITAINPVTKEMTSNNITITSRFANNTDVTKYYRNDTQYYITLIGDDGKPVGAGETVTFNINGVMYERQTNANGTARLNINLNPGEYVITAMYKNCMVSNNIKVLPIIIAENIEMTYKDGTQFKAKLVDGQGNPVSGVNLTFNINGVFYNRTTGNDGIAKLNINLMAGEYIITSYYGSFATSNKITIKP